MQQAEEFQIYSLPDCIPHAVKGIIFLWNGFHALLLPKGRQLMTINEIARMAGVSRTTVSRYLNDGYVSREKADRIRSVIESTGYQPSRQAQMLRTKRTNLIGVILPKLNSDSISREIDSITTVLAKAGYEVLLANTNNQEQEEIKYLKLFAANGSVDAVILIGTIWTKEHDDILREYPLPVVVLGQHCSTCSCVYFDDYKAAKQQAEILARTGKRIGYIGVTELDEAAGHNRKAGFLDAMSEAGIAVPPEAMVVTGFRIQSGYEAAEELLSRYPDPDSIFCATDSIAVGAMVCLRERGYRIPEDIQITGIGDSEKGQVVTPRLSTVHYYYKTSGKETARLLLGLLSGSKQNNRAVRMGCKLTSGESIRLPNTDC